MDAERQGLTDLGPVTGALDEGGLRVTRQRRAVAAVIERSVGFTSARQVYELLAEEGASVGLATVYRCLHALDKAGVIDSIRSEAGEMLYRRHCADCDAHLVCRRCGRTVDIGSQVIEHWVRGVIDNHGFSDVAYTFELFGTCPDCLREASGDASAGRPMPGAG